MTITVTTTPTWHITTPMPHNQDISVTSTTQLHPLGTIIRAADVSNGEGEFIYLQGVANTVAGAPVTWNSTTYQTTLAAVGANVPYPIAFAMSANVASQFGWYQISGLVIALKTSTVSIPVGAVGILTAGLVAKTGTGKELQGVTCPKISSSKTGNTTVFLMANRPHLQGRIT